MFQQLPLLARTVRIGAANGHLIFHAHNRRATGGTLTRHTKHLLGAVTNIRDRSDHLGNDIPGPLNNNRISYSQVLVMYVLLVVQGGHTHRHPPHHNRFKNRVWVEHPRTATLTLISLSTVCAVDGANLCAMAQRGSRATLPNRPCRRKSSTFTTMPSMS